ncbi:MAG: dTDP-4-dehydrorhamnose reductase family protein [Planctomycetota bacterium]|jgi:dTDP-4-dehydrorhamnose reductase
MRKILILGGTGMLGHTLFAYLTAQQKWDVYATSRTEEGLAPWFPSHSALKQRGAVDANNFDTVVRALASIQPDIVINCIGLIKQLPLAYDPLTAITVNSQLPHRISLICRTAGARMIHISTDCVFDGRQGDYKEDDPSDANDLYGRTKFLGEVKYPHCVTVRTSIIGHELKGLHGLIEWFLRQEGSVRGFTNAIFSGFPTIELARIIGEYIINNDDLQGLYHVSAEPISKYELLRIVAERYGKKIVIEPYNDFHVNRSLDSSAFRKQTQYSPPPWPELIDKMYDNFVHALHYKNRTSN